MNPLAAIGKSLGTFAVILGINAVLRGITRGFDSALYFSLWGIVVAAGIGVAATLAEEDRRKKHETVNPEEYAAKRRLILAAAAPVFAQCGYDGATTAGICREADIGNRILARYLGEQGRA